MIVENLLQFGLNEKQISVYLSLIALGPSPVREIARTAQINRGTTYDILKTLIELGLVSYYKQYNQENRRQYFVAEPPQKLLDAIETKKRSLDTLKEYMAKSLPELESLYEKSGARPVVKYYEGVTGIRTILEDVIGSLEKSPAGEKEYFVYSSADLRKYLYQAFRNFNDERLRRGIAVKAIAIGKGGELAGLDERKWLAEEEGAPAYILIYSGKVGMISLDASRKPVGLIIENPGLCRTQEMIFKKLWKSL